jgi:hypothetical protein
MLQSNCPYIHHLKYTCFSKTSVNSTEHTTEGGDCCGNLQQDEGTCKGGVCLIFECAMLSLHIHSILLLGKMHLPGTFIYVWTCNHFSFWFLDHLVLFPSSQVCGTGLCATTCSPSLWSAGTATTHCCKAIWFYSGFGVLPCNSLPGDSDSDHILTSTLTLSHWAFRNSFQNYPDKLLSDDLDFHTLSVVKKVCWDDVSIAHTLRTSPTFESAHPTLPFPYLLISYCNLISERSLKL